MFILGYMLTAVAAYLLGSIPTGYLVGRQRGVDIRIAGSGNIGATNVFRILGKSAGICVLLLDALKGFVAVALVLNYFHALNEFLPQMFPVDAGTLPEVRLNHAILAGVCAVIGHNYSCWLGFKGGKGIATSAGVYLALAPLAVGIALGVWIILFVISRYVSVASVAAAVALPTAVWFTTNSVCFGIVTTALGALAIYKHKANIQRLLTGAENRVHFKKDKTVT